MNPAFTAALRFYQKAGQAQSVPELNALFEDAVKPFGFDTYGFVELRVPGRPLVPKLLFGKTDRAWDMEYARRKLYRFDPVVPYLFTAIKPFTWSEVEGWKGTADSRRLFGEARDAGAGEGLIVPIHGAAGESHLVKLTTPAPLVDPDIRPAVHGLAQVYASHGRTLFEAGPEQRGRIFKCCPLTPRELQCLSLVAENKSDWDIGVILAISPNTVHTLIERAKKRLGVHSRMDAVIIAKDMGWLSNASPG